MNESQKSRLIEEAGKRWNLIYEGCGKLRCIQSLYEFNTYGMIDAPHLYLPFYYASNEIIVYGAATIYRKHKRINIS